ncbi:hypothetical protein PVAP13_2NG579060 [Panicum virgatum]|uniref:Uncharacterized protein n=1 Tax=Panicum virgatum TaxID=38727 RepID=A0A8T0VT73_PANVG|nr:hypothetical protein PVAP13_2NG579060 [Panicum virgatum]
MAMHTVPHCKSDTLAKQIGESITHGHTNEQNTIENNHWSAVSIICACKVAMAHRSWLRRHRQLRLGQGLRWHGQRLRLRLWWHGQGLRLRLWWHGQGLWWHRQRLRFGQGLWWHRKWLRLGQGLWWHGKWLRLGQGLWWYRQRLRLRLLGLGQGLWGHRQRLRHRVLRLGQRRHVGLRELLHPPRRVADATA